MKSLFSLSAAAELDYMEGFILNACMDVDVARDQLRSLWTTYCLHFGLDVDTIRYDTLLRDLYRLMVDGNGEEEDTGDWSDFESFDRFMCKYLV